MGKFVEAVMTRLDHVLRNSNSSRIILALLSTGEAYIVDLRSIHRGRFELCDEDEGDERARYVPQFTSSVPSKMTPVDFCGFHPKLIYPYDLLCSIEYVGL